jgi:hypothetical protein
VPRRRTRTLNRHEERLEVVHERDHERDDECHRDWIHNRTDRREHALEERGTRRRRRRISFRRRVGDRRAQGAVRERGSVRWYARDLRNCPVARARCGRCGRQCRDLVQQCRLLLVLGCRSAHFDIGSARLVQAVGGDWDAFPEHAPVYPSADGLLVPAHPVLGLDALGYTRSIVPRERSGGTKDPEGDVVGNDENGNVRNADWKGTR